MTDDELRARVSRALRHYEAAYYPPTMTAEQALDVFVAGWTCCPPRTTGSR